MTVWTLTIHRFPARRQWSAIDGSPRNLWHHPHYWRRASFLVNMGRPPANGHAARSKTISVPVTEEEHKIFSDQAVAVGLPIGIYARSFIYGEQCAISINDDLDVGETKLVNGYLWEKIGTRLVPQHRHRMEKYLGRPLRLGEVVHHVDGNKTNNDIGNLALLTKAQHNRLHGLQCPKFSVSDRETIVSELETEDCQEDLGIISQVETKAALLQKTQSKQAVATGARTRARAPEELRDLRTKNTESPSSSLRSSQREPSAAPASDPDDCPWQPPEPIKLTIKLSTGETATNVWMFSNGSKIPPADVDRVMNTPALKTFRQAMLKCFARSLRDSYRLKWCGAMNKRRNAWRDTPKSTASFLAAAKFLAAEYITRQMSASEFIDACNEMRPKAIKFVTSDLLPGIGSRVAAWIPESQRERDKSWSTHKDTDGMTWITPIGEQPVVVLRTVADRQKFMEAHKVR